MNSFILIAFVGGVVSLLVFFAGLFSVSECSIKGYCTTRRIVSSVVAGLIGVFLFLLFVTPRL